MKKRKIILIGSIIVVILIAIVVGLLLNNNNKELKDWHDYIYDNTNSFKEYNINEENDSYIYDTGAKVYYENMKYLDFSGTAYFYRFDNNNIKNVIKIKLDTSNQTVFENQLNALTDDFKKTTNYDDKINFSFDIQKTLADEVDEMVGLRMGSVMLHGEYKVDNNRYKVFFYPYNNAVYALLVYENY